MSDRDPGVDARQLAEIRSLARFPDENPNPVMRFARDGRILYANNPSARLLHHWRVDVRGGDLPPFVRAAVKRALSSGTQEHLEVDCVGVVYSLNLCPVPAESYVNGYARDVTAQRHAEARNLALARFPDENPNPVLRVSRDDATIIYANARAAPVLEAWETEVGGSPPETIRLAVLQGIAEDRGTSIEAEAAGAVYALQFEPIPGTEYANVYGRDVTSLKNAEGAVREANEQLQAQNRLLAEKNEELRQADRMKDEFLANTSHELRTPLHGIVGIAESLLDGASGELPDPARADLALVVDSARRLARLVDDILDFSKLRERTIELALRAVDLRTIADVVTLLLSPLARSKGLRLENLVPAGLPLVRADEDRLQQILHNLVGNAIKFTAQGHVAVGAEVVGEGDRRQAVVSVADTGIGIAESAQARIFEAFQQEDGSTSRAYGGTGLGLSVTRALVELHGGRIAVESSPGRGARFSFELDLARADDAPMRRATEVARVRRSPSPDGEGAVRAEPIDVPTAAEDTSTRAPAVALIVDDEPVNLKVLENHLAQRNYQVVRAANGAEALAHVAAGLKPDVVLLDVMMPRMSGYEVCREIRRRHSADEVPIVLVTARGQIADLVTGLESGANDYLTKPVSKSELLARMETHIGVSRMGAATRRFVPREFLRILGHETLAEVSRGDHLEREMSILFSDIRSFTTLVEGRTPAQNFELINEYFAHMEPPIRDNGGFIDGFEGDSIMALFDGPADGAVRAGIEDLRALRVLNEARARRGDAPMAAGVGVNTGRLMLGTIGGEERLKCGVIGDPVNLASRIEGMTKIYGASMLISEFTHARLADPGRYAMRPLDRVRARGKSQAVTIWEVLDGLPDRERHARLATSAAFTAAFALYRDGAMSAALDAFTEVLARDPGDGAARLHRDRCQEHLAAGLPAGWDGVVSLAAK